jgi:hypothetical protein
MAPAREGDHRSRRRSSWSKMIMLAEGDHVTMAPRGPIVSAGSTVTSAASW